MSFKTTYVLFGIFALVLIAFGLTLWLGPRGQNLSDYVLASAHDPANPVTAKKIDTVEIDRTEPQQKIVFIKDPSTNSWKMTQPTEWPADSGLVDNIVSSVLDARKDRNADLNANLAEWGLDHPSAVVTLRAGDGREWKLNLGKERPGKATGVVYVTSSDEPKEPLAVRRTDLESLFHNVNDFRSKDLFAGTRPTLVYVKLQEAPHSPVVLNKEGFNEWKFEEPRAYGPADYDGATPAPGSESREITGVGGLLSAIEDLKVASDADFVADNVRDWAQYGLDKPGLTITVKRQENPDQKGYTQQAVMIGGKADPKGDKVYARLADSSAVVRLGAQTVQPILKVAADPQVLRSRDLIRVDEARVDAIDIQNKNVNGTLKLRRVNREWKLFDPSVKESKADDPAVLDLLKALAVKRLVLSFPPANKEAEYGFAQPQAVVSIWVGGIQQTATKAAQGKNDKKAEAEPKPKGEPAVYLPSASRRTRKCTCAGPRAARRRCWRCRRRCSPRWGRAGWPISVAPCRRSPRTTRSPG
jgi:hypothetical protein